MADKQIVEYDSAPRVAFDLMEKISRRESSAKEREQQVRDYWITLYVQCFSATHGMTAKHIL